MFVANHESLLFFVVGVDDLSQSSLSTLDAGGYNCGVHEWYEEVVKWGSLQQFQVAWLQCHIRIESQ